MYYSSTTLYYNVLQRTTPVLLCTTKYYSSTTLYCKALLQYYSVLQSTTPVLLCTTRYYSSTTLYYKVLLQYYSVLQGTTPVLLCTTKYYSSTTLYYTVLLQYYSSTTLYYKVLRPSPKMSRNAAPDTKSHTPTSPNTAPATQNESHHWSASHMKRHLQCAEQQESASHFTKYCACHAKWISWLIRIRYETSFTMRGATLVTVQHHQILRLPRNSEFKISAQNPWIVSANIKTIRPWSEHEIVISHPPLQRPYSSDLGDDFVLKNTTFRAPAISQNVTKCCACHEKSHSNFTKYCACHAKWISSLIRLTYETSFTMRGATSVTLQLHQILRLPRKMNLMIDPHQIWNVIYNARSKQCQPPTSANTAPATKSLSSRLQRKLSELLPPI